MIYTLYLSSLIVSAAIAGVLAYYLWRRRSKPGAKPVVWVMLAVVVWSLGYALELESTTLSGQIFAANIQYFGIVTVPVMWFAFSLEYTGHDKWLTRRNLFLLAIVPFVTVALAWTNDIHSLMWYGRHLETSGPFMIIAKTYGPWFWIHTSYSYLLLLSGMFFLLQRLFRPPRLYREQSIALLICVIVPLAWNVLYIFDLAPIYRVDLTPSAFVISGLAIAWGLFRFRLFDIIPLARDTVIEGMSDGVIVLDTENRFVDLNRAAERIVGCTPSEAIGQPAANVLSRQPELVELFCGMTGASEGRVEVEIEKGETQRCYESHISPLYNRRGRLTGRLATLIDITERKRAEKQAKQLKEYLELQIDRMPIGLVVWDTEFRAQSWNPAAEKIFGFTIEEALGKHPYDLIVPKEAQPHVDNIWHRLLEGDTAAHSINENMTKDGRTIICEWTNTPLKKADGTVVGVLSMIQDITEGKRTEEALRESEEKYRKIVENVHDMVYSCYPDGTLYFVSPNVLSLTGYKVEEGIGRNMMEFVHPDDKERVLSDLEKTIKTGEEFPTIFRLLKKDGSYLYVEELGKVTKEGGKPVGLTGVIRDITERKRVERALEESESHFRSVAESANDAIITADSRGNIIFWNKAAEDVFGYLADEAVGKSSTLIMPERLREAFENGIKRVVSTGKSDIIGRTIEVVGLRKDGSELPVELSLAKWEVGEETFFTAIVRDITERKRAEKKIFEYKELSKLKSNLLSTVSHELRTPLATIKGYATMLLDYNERLGPEEKGEQLQSIERATDRLTELVDHLLDMSRLEAGLLKLEKTPASILKLVRGVVAETQLRAPRHQIVSKLDKGLPRVNIDAKRIRQVLDNLIDNAIKYSEEGTEVRVVAERVGSELRISVADQGIGIPAEELGKVFDRMYRIEQRLTPQLGGVGLGLAICRGLVEAHSGRIWVESEVGKGSTFYFTLPIQSEAEEYRHGKEA